MGFQKVENGDNRNLYLSDFDNVDIINKVCYVLHYKSGVSVLQKGYYSLIIKTADGVAVPALIFNVSDFTKLGLDIASLKGKFVSISGVPRNNNGYMLEVRDIARIPETKVAEREKFIGKVDSLDEMFEDIKNMVASFDPNEVVPLVYKIKGYSEIYNGQIGGYVKFIWCWMYQIMVYSDEYGKDLLEIFYNCVLYYAKYLDRLSLLPVVTSMDKLSILTTIPNDGTEKNNVVADCMSAILGISQPEHLYAHIVYETFSLVKSLAYKSQLWSSIPMGGVKVLNGKDSVLKRY